MASGDRHVRFLRDGSLLIVRPCCGAKGVLTCRDERGQPTASVRIPHKSTCERADGAAL